MAIPFELSRFSYAEPDDLGLGVSLQAHYQFSERLSAGITASLFSFGFTAVPTPNNDAELRLTIIPLTAGIEYRFGQGALEPYLGLGGGIALVDGSGDLIAFDTGVEIYPQLSPYFGLRYSFSNAFGLYGQVGYQLVFYDFNNTSFLPIGVGAFVRL